MSTSKDVKLMSLDDYIKKRGIDEQFDLFSFRKSKFVDLSLNELVKEKSKLDLKNKVEKGRFDRPSLRDNSDNESDGDEEIDSEHRAVEDDVEMKDESNEHINSYETQLNPDNCDQIERFTTVEQLNNIKVSSQGD